MKNPLTTVGLLPDIDELGKVVIVDVSKNKFNKIKFHAGLCDKDWQEYKDAMVLIIVKKENMDSARIQNNIKK